MNLATTMELYSTPLVSLDAVVLDTETTGLDARTARLLQIGAVRVTGTKIDSGERFETLVNPGIQIPAASTAVHGISDGDVADAPVAREALTKFQSYLDDAVVIGHTIGYDLEILQREAGAAGLEWDGVRTLDVRRLARLVTSSLADYSLDGLCEWLDIEITGRHTAMGDAIATAEVYAALVPLLRGKGIRTLAEADRALHRLAEKEEGGLAGSHLTQPAPHHRKEIETLSRIDSFPYRHRVLDVMSTPPLVVSSETKIDDAIAIMLDRDTSSVFVEGKNGVTGIVTERDVLRAAHHLHENVFDSPVETIMHAPLECVRDTAFVYKAIGRMDRLGFRHLGVRNVDGEIVGVVTTRNLLRHRASTAMVLGDEIDGADDSAALGAAWARVPLMARRLVEEDVDARQISAVISEEICMITRRAAELAEEAMRHGGQGEPPVPYAVLVMGSAGRGESLLAADQDNAIVFESGKPGGPEEKWFEMFGTRIANILDEVGVPYCKGGVMVKNAAWRKNVTGWKETIDTWVRRQSPDDLLNVDIFYDAVPVHGDYAMGRSIWNYAYDCGSAAPTFVRLLAELLREWRAPLTFFGNIRTADNGRVDLKQGGLLPILTSARVLSIKNNIKVRSTPERLRGVLDKGIGSPSDLEDVIDAHRVVLKAMLTQQLADGENGVPLTPKVDPSILGTGENKKLRDALKRIDAVVDLAREGML